MDSSMLLDLQRTYAERTIASEYLLLGICSVLPKDQAEKILAFLAQIQGSFDALPVETDGMTEIRAGIMFRLSPFIQTLSGHPPPPSFH